MKWRLTGRYLTSVVLIVIIVIIINIFVVIGLYVFQMVNRDVQVESKSSSADTITRSFQKEIVMNGAQLSITEDGKEVLKRNQAWIQILDENGRQVFGYLVPEGAKTKYTPLDIVQIYKYKEADVLSTVFVGEKSGNGHRYSYFIGFTDPYLERQILTFDLVTLGKVLRLGSLVLIVVDGFIALCIAYMFSKRLTRPLHALIDGIKRLANKNYQVMFEPKGIYKDVFYNVNQLSLELKAGEKERKKLDRMKEEWIGNISHDIKTPLASIQGYAEMMKDKDYQFTMDEMREYAEIIERKSLYMKDVIEDLNLSTRLKNQELNLNKENVNIVSLVRNTVIDMLNDSQYSNRNIDFQYSDEEIRLDVDKILIRRAVSNLIYNAIVHNDEQVTILVQVEKKNSHVVIRVEDNGIGISPEDMDSIFDRYYRGTHTGELHKGSGLGMAITRDIVMAHNGEIRVESEKGKGTVIEITLDM